MIGFFKSWRVVKYLALLTALWYFWPIIRFIIMFIYYIIVSVSKFLTNIPSNWSSFSERCIDYDKLSIWQFPALHKSCLKDVKKGTDKSFKEFSREYGAEIEAYFDPLFYFLNWFERLLNATPWLLIVLIVGALAYLGSRSWKLSIGAMVSFLLIGYLGMWKNTMSTVALISVATLLCVIIGIPLGIWMSRSDRVQKIVTPILDIMQTIPIFVYLLPVVMLLGIGKVPGLIAVCVYAMPPVIRLTNLGLRLVNKDILEAADSFGSNYWQRLINVQFPLALPNIFAGVNQTIMMALAMVVIASMIGVKGLGVPVLQSIQNQYLALGLMNGLAIVALAIIFDRVSQQYGKRLQRHREGGHDA